MWRKLWDFFRRKKTPPGNDRHEEILAEVQAIRKLARKQGAFLEKMREELLRQGDLRLHVELEPLLRFADAFFHLDRFFQDQQDFSPQRQQALRMVWEQLDGLLAAANIEMVRERRAPFDERVHEAVANAAPEAAELAVIDMIQPGYVCNGRVLQAARVVLGSPANNGGREQEHQSTSEEATQNAETDMRY